MSSPHDADLVLVIVPTSAGRNNPQLYRSTDGGSHWQLIEQAIDWDPIIQNRVKAGTHGGKIYCCNDGRQLEPVRVYLPTIAIGAMLVAQTST